MKKNEQVAECTGDVLVLQLARVALPVFALVVIYVVSLTAPARLALTLQGTLELELYLEKSPLRLVGGLFIYDHCCFIKAPPHILKEAFGCSLSYVVLKFSSLWVQYSLFSLTASRTLIK